MIVANKINQSAKFQCLGTFIGDILWTPYDTKMYAHISYVGMQPMEGWRQVKAGMFEDISYYIMVPRTSSKVIQTMQKGLSCIIEVDSFAR